MNEKEMRCISGGVFALLSVMYLWNFIGSLFSSYVSVPYIIMDLLKFASMGLITLSLFIDWRPIMTVGSAVGIVTALFCTFLMRNAGLSGTKLALQNGFLTYVSLLVISLQPKPGMILGIILAALYIAFALLFGTGKPITYLLSGEGLSVAGTVFAGLAFSGDGTPAFNKRSHTANKASAHSSVADAAEVLIRLKGLLDAGAITQEEFDEKKRELLGQ